MPIEKQTSPFELLIRWDEKGALAAALYTERVQYVEDGKVTSTVMSPQVQLDRADTGPDSQVGRIMGRALADAMVERTSFDAKMAALAQERDAALAKAEAAQRAIESAAKQMAGG